MPARGRTLPRRRMTAAYRPQMNASALLEYFAPLSAWLDQQTANAYCYQFPIDANKERYPVALAAVALVIGEAHAARRCAALLWLC